MRFHDSLQTDRAAILQLANMVFARDEDEHSKLVLLGVLARADQLLLENSLSSSHEAMEFVTTYGAKMDEVTNALGMQNFHDLIEEGAFGNVRNALMRAAGEALSGRLSIMLRYVP